MAVGADEDRIAVEVELAEMAPLLFGESRYLSTGQDSTVTATEDELAFREVPPSECPCSFRAGLPNEDVTDQVQMISPWPSTPHRMPLDVDRAAALRPERTLREERRIRRPCRPVD